MKLFFLSFLFFFSGLNVFAQQTVRYQVFTNRIIQFSKPCKVLYNNVDAQGNGSIEFTNSKKQILRFRVNKHQLQVLHGGIAFQLFDYENDFLQKIASFDSNGDLAGERESQNEAIVKFTIEKKAAYLQKKKILDDAEGNIDMKDDSAEKIISIQLFDANNLPISILKPNYINTKTYYNYCHRMYWP